jgi:hypothetical protein
LRSLADPSEFDAACQRFLNVSDEQDLFYAQQQAEEAFQDSLSGFSEGRVSAESVTFSAIALVCHTNLPELGTMILDVGASYNISSFAVPDYPQLLAKPAASFLPNEASRRAFETTLTVLTRLVEKLRTSHQLSGQEVHASKGVLRVIRNYVVCRFVGFRHVLARRGKRELMQQYEETRKQQYEKTRRQQHEETTETTTRLDEQQNRLLHKEQIEQLMFAFEKLVPSSVRALLDPDGSESRKRRQSRFGR